MSKSGDRLSFLRGRLRYISSGKKILTASTIVPALLAAAKADTNYLVLKPFGALVEDGFYPTANAIQGTDGAFYGTTISDWNNQYGVIYRQTADGTGYSILHRFSGAPGDGRVPRSRLAEGSDGALYGITDSAVTGDNFGTMFKLNKDGTDYTVLHRFGITPGDGKIPEGALIQGSDGMLYGTTLAGGTNSKGTVYSMSLDGSTYGIIYHFRNTGNDGTGPYAAMMEASDGMLYGTTRFGGSNVSGTVFRLNKDGSNYQRLYSFRNSGGDGADPYNGPVVEGWDGFLYGTTYSGGTAAYGTMFWLAKDGTSYGILRQFGTSANDARHPWGLLSASDGLLYGTTLDGGGTNANGTVFKIAIDGLDYRVLHSFGVPTSDGRGASPGLTQASDDMLYGTTTSGGVNVGTAFRINKDGSSYSVFHAFGLLPNDGHYPWAALMQASDSKLYGTAAGGGDSGYGIVFSIHKDGSGYTILHSFSGGSSDGANPHGSPLEASDGMLYGTTAGGGLGTIFQVNKDGTIYNVLHSFSTGMGQNPQSSLIEGSDGILYGTTQLGGVPGYGIVFAVRKDGSDFNVLHSFTNSPGDGASPLGALVETLDAMLYGTTSSGGTGTNGTVFKIAKNAGSYEIVHSFLSTRFEGAAPNAGLLVDHNGVLYGTAASGGRSNFGTVFKVSRDGSGFTVLHHFGDIGNDGNRPLGPLIDGNDGVLYGSTQNGGTAGQGTVFRINKDGSDYAVVRSFTTASAGGVNLFGGLIQADDGALYGTTYGGGNFNFGTVFRMLAPQRPVISSFYTASNIVQVTISGTSGYNYSLYRSTNLITWSILTNNIMPSTGTLISRDSNPPEVKAFYRVALAP